MRLVPTGCVLGALAVLFCGASARAEVIHVQITNLVFSPPQVTAHVGDTVEWVNGDFVAHTATARNGAWDVMILPKSSKSVVVKAAGEVDYYCKFHPQMVGKITVSK